MQSHQITLKLKPNRRVYTFIANTTTDEGDVYIKMGSTKRTKECVFLTYNQDLSNLSCELQNFEFSPECADNTDLESGMNGTVPMMLAALHFTYDAFPHIRQTEFNDKSVLPGQISASLIDYNFLRTGQSWYQKMFGAELVLQDEKTRMLISKRKILDIVNVSVQEFLKRSRMFSSKTAPDSFSRIYQAHLNDQPWMALFDALSKDSDVRLEFMLAVRHIMRWFEISSFAGTYWTMKKSRICKMRSDLIQSIQISPSNKRLGQVQMQGGGRDRHSGLIHMHGGWNLGLSPGAMI